MLCCVELEFLGNTQTDRRRPKFPSLADQKLHIFFASLNRFAQRHTVGMESTDTFS